MIDRNRASLAAVAMALLLALSSCHHTDAGLDGTSSVDTNVAHRPGASHFDPCVTDVDCPIGDLCSFADASPPTADRTAPLQCRPHCMADSDCVTPLAGITIAVQCASDHYCVGWCSPAPLVLPPCMSPAQCHVFPGLQQGYCFLPAH